MKKVVVAGGGFAGLSVSCFLANKNFQIELIESSPKLGGRAYSFLNKESNSLIDNGQHILMGCYNETLNFLKLINAENNLIYQKRLKINFVSKNKNIFLLQAANFPYPFNLLFGLINYKAVTASDRIKIIYFFAKIFLSDVKLLQNKNVESWLDENFQNIKIKKALWEIIAVGALNTNIKKASAKIFADILKQIFFTGNFSSTIILPKYCLTSTYCLPAEKFIKSRNGNLNLSESIIKIEFENELAKKIITNKRVISDFDYLILTMPSYSLKKIIGYESILFEELPRFNYSSILNVHIWLKENPLKKKFYGLINSKIHWIFNHNSYISITISDAEEFIAMEKSNLFNLICNELELFFNFNKGNIQYYKIIKEKKATFIPSSDIINKRPNANTKIKNVFLAGDWTDTGLPATIESAVKSGRKAAESISSL